MDLPLHQDLWVKSLMESKGMPVAEELAQILMRSKAQKKVGLQVRINNHNNINDKHAWLVKNDIVVDYQLGMLKRFNQVYLVMNSIYFQLTFPIYYQFWNS